MNSIACHVTEWKIGLYQSEKHIRIQIESSHGHDGWPFLPLEKYRQIVEIIESGRINEPFQSQSVLVFVPSAILLCHGQFTDNKIESKHFVLALTPFST